MAAAVAAAQAHQQQQQAATAAAAVQLAAAAQGQQASPSGDAVNRHFQRTMELVSRQVINTAQFNAMQHILLFLTVSLYNTSY